MNGRGVVHTGATLLGHFDGVTAHSKAHGCDLMRLQFISDLPVG